MERRDMTDYLGKDIFKLGFGLMRLPKLEDGSIDVEQVKVMADKFIAAGGKYFDSAYLYDGGGSERAFKEAVVDRYPRDAYYIATKLSAAIGVSDEESAKNEFNISLERTGAGYFDFYLLHGIQNNNISKYDEYGIWDYVRGLKEQGLVKHYGFSFHGTPELLDELLSKHPDVDFVQLQINYADWEDERVASRRCYEVVRKHNKPLTVMEPIKGGKLANPADMIKDVFQKANPDASCASWAVRFVASLDGIITVLSGMSNIEQIEDNLSYMKDFKPLSEDERKVIEEVQRILKDDKQIKCTACHCCTEGCPMSIPIPEIFSLKNQQILFSLSDEQLRRDYMFATHNRGKASDCIECGQCEGACPQHLTIIDLLKTCRSME